MILSHRYKFLFIHPAKTGGTSVELAFCELTNTPFKQTYENDELSVVENCKHSSARELRNIIGDEIWNNYFKVGFVRNPYERLLSDFSMHQQMQQDHPWLKRDWQRYPDFRSFLEAVRNEQVRVPQEYLCSMLADDKGRLLVDFVGRFERLQDDFNYVCDRIGLPRTELPRVSTSRHGSWEGYYTADTRAAVARYSRMDFERFGYPT